MTPRPDKNPQRSEPGNDNVLVGRQPVMELLKAGRPIQRIFVADSAKSSTVVREIMRVASASGVPVRRVPRGEIERRAGGANHQGVLAETARYRYTPLSKLLSEPNIALLFLDGVTDPNNLGSLLRSADAAGFQGVVIPSHRSSSVTVTVRRVSAGASELVPVARVSSLGSALDDARSAGLWIVGLDGHADEEVWDTNLLDRPVGLVLGAEDRGLSSSVRARCDGFLSIPQRGKLDSLNVAVAGALAMFEVARRDSATLRS
jgi:23S rRNA (guanosine2251-2'-O)-methyltransferase